MVSAPIQTVFGDVVGIKRINVYRGAQMVHNFSPDTSLDVMRDTLADHRQYGDLILKPVTSLGVAAEPSIPLHVPVPSVEADTLEAALNAATHNLAQQRLDVAREAEINARSAEAESRLTLEIARARGDAHTARIEADQLRSELDQMRALMKSRIELATSEAETDAKRRVQRAEDDAERRVKRVQDEAETAETRFNLKLGTMTDRHANEIANLRQMFESQVTNLTQELTRERLERQSAQRALEKERNEWTEERRIHQEELYKLRAKLANQASPGVQRVQELTEIAKAVSGAPDEATRGVMMGLLSAEAGVSPPSRFDQLVDLIAHNAEIQSVLARAADKIFSDDKRLPASSESKEI